MPDSTPSSVANALGPVLAVLAGSVLALQSRLNGALGTRLGDPVAAAFAAVVVGVTAVTAVSVLSATNRHGLRRLVRQLREGRVSWWFLLAGLIGALFVFAQTRTADTLGVSVLLLAVMGQSLGGLAVDRWGIGPGGVRRVTGLRVLGTAMVVAAVLLAVSPRLASAAGASRRSCCCRSWPER
ncbi:DMT family transporter [Kocuria sp. CH-021]|uniref:DMT family transporter n=1 Tax=Kocuria sp. CH-021 TaxID=3406735 RepID=UPI003C744DD3